MTLLLAAKGSEFASAFAMLLESVDRLGLTEQVVPGIQEKVAKQVQSGVMRKLSEQLPDRMRESGLGK